MPCHDCVNRRDFLTRSALAAAALVALEGCGDGQIGPPDRSGAQPSGGAVTIKLSDFPALATVGVPVILKNERAVVRTGASSFVAVSRICTHQGCDIDVQGDHFQCPCHLSQFTATGAVIRGPTTGESIGPLHQLAVTFDATAGTLTVA